MGVLIPIQAQRQFEDFFHFGIDQFDVTRSWFSCRDGARFVDDERVGFVGLFQRFDALDEQPVLGTNSSSNNQGGWRG